MPVDIADKALNLAGFTLAFLALIAGLNKEALPGLKVPLTILTATILLFLGTSEVCRNAANLGEYILGNSLYHLSL